MPRHLPTPLLTASIVLLCAAMFAPAAALAAGDAQQITFDPPWTGSLGDSITLTATASSGLPVAYSTTSPSICSVDGSDLTFNVVGTCSVTASQSGDGDWAPAPPVKHDIDVELGYHATATATHNGILRTDGAIQVGDTLDLVVYAPDTDLTWCIIRVVSGEGIMTGEGAIQPDGSCTLSMVLPRRLAAARGSRVDDDICVSVPNLTFADAANRVMATSDRKLPGGVGCFNASYRDPGADEVLDFNFDGSGTHKTFSSSPKLLSWDIADWDSSYVPLSFNEDWHVSFPAWVESCDGPSLNGSWQTTYSMKNVGEGCRNWDLHLPGVLPATMPWGGGPGAWDMEIVITYSTDQGERNQTIAWQSVPFEPSDGIFESSFPAVSPTDLAAARFVTVGERWRPSFQVSGPLAATSCVLLLQHPESGLPDSDYDGALDANGLCTFDLPSFTSEGQWGAYGVIARVDGPLGFDVSYGGSITAIAAPSAPVIPDPTLNSDGTMTVAADAGTGQGMSLQMAISAAPAAVSGAAWMSTAAATCSAVSYSATMETGGSLGRARKKCALPPGVYVIRARMVDATGKVTSRKRTVTIAGANGAGSLAMPVTSVTHGASGKTIVFTYTAGPGGMYNGVLRLTVPIGWSAPSLSHTAPGFAKASLGTLTVAQRTLIVSGLTRAAGQTFTLTYGAKSAGGPGAHAPTNALGSQTWTTAQKSTAAGTLKLLGSQPSITVS